MDIGKAGSAPAIKTEWRNNPAEADKPSGPKEESFGSQLNRMSGVNTVNKNLYEKKGELNKEAYLKMLMEQIKFQDPMNPVKNDQFSQQMTSLSQLEQQVNTNKNLEKMMQQQSNTQLAALQLVGKNILADRAAIYHDEGKVSPINFKLPRDAQEVVLEVYDGNNEKVRSFNMGAQNEGDIRSKWDGANDQGGPAASGRYSYKIKAKGVDGKDFDISSKIDGRVTGVTTSQGTVFLLVGDQRVGLSDIETIKEGSLEEKKPDALIPGMKNESPKVETAAASANVDAAPKVEEAKKEPELSVSDDAARSLAGPGSTGGMLPIFMR